MATGQTLLNLMEVLDQELQLQPGEADVVRGLAALNAAQDHFESLAMQRKGIYSIGSISTTASTETTAFPAGMLRLDALRRLENSRPTYFLRKNQGEGGRSSVGWPYVVSTGSGAPRAYWSDGSNVYWDPEPDATYSVRYYGFVAATDITAGGTFAYKDIAQLPLAVFAAKLMKSGLGDPIDAVASLAQETFKPVLDSLEMFNRDGGLGLRYGEVHDA